MIKFRKRVQTYDLVGDALDRALGKDGRVTFDKEDGEVINIHMTDGRQMDLGFSKDTVEIIKEQ